MIVSPDCPECGEPPVMTWLLPYFCGNPRCSVMSWDPLVTLAELRTAEAYQVDLSALPDPGERSE